jgi:hypothetical protein
VLELDGTVSRGKDGDTVEANDEYDEQYSEWGQTDLMAAVAMPEQGHPSPGLRHPRRVRSSRALLLDSVTAAISCTSAGDGRPTTTCGSAWHLGIWGRRNSCDARSLRKCPAHRQILYRMLGT